MPNEPTLTSSFLLNTDPGPALIPALVVVHHTNPDFIGQRRPISAGDDLLVGRDSPHFPPGTLSDARISRRHAEVRRSKDAIVLQDLGSHNGTRVNGRKVDEHTLNPGDLISIGETLLVFQLTLNRPWVQPDSEMLGISDAIAEVHDRIRLIADRDTTVLVQGPPGVGKELVAKAVHAHSQRSGKIVAVNCGSIQDSLLQSELFGHTRGAFSGADRARRGLVETARGGTLFLDEIGDAPPNLQVALLRLLQEGTFRAVGEDHDRTADVRVICATNRDLDAFVQQDRFRADLLSRLRQWEIHVPPLQDRIEDIPILATRFALEAAGSPVTLETALLAALCWQPWPGNVRELRATMERIVIESRGAAHIRCPRWLPRKPVQQKQAAEWRGASKVRPSSEELRARMIHHRVNIKALAKELGIGRNTLYRWIEEAGIDVDAVRASLT